MPAGRGADHEDAVDRRCSGQLRDRPRRAGLPGRRVHVRQRLRNNWRCWRATVRPRDREHQLRFERRLPACRRPARAHQAGDQPARSPPVQAQLLVLLGRGFQIGGNWRWNSGTFASRTFRASNRNLPIRVEPGEEFEFAGITRRWLSPTAVGTLRNPSHGIVDLRLLYNYGGRGYRLELFADIFNLFDNQDAIRTQDLVAGAGGNEFGDGIRFTPPRRVFLGIRASFG